VTFLTNALNQSMQVEMIRMLHVHSNISITANLGGYQIVNITSS